MLKRVYKSSNQISDKKLIGKNKVIITFITNTALNGTGFKAEARLSKF